jgi:hypothetical protein
MSDLEQLAGVFYAAILIARLTGLMPGALRQSTWRMSGTNGVTRTGVKKAKRRVLRLAARLAHNDKRD